MAQGFVEMIPTIRAKERLQDIETFSIANPALSKQDRQNKSKAIQEIERQAKGNQSKIITPGLRTERLSLADAISRLKGKLGSG